MVAYALSQGEPDSSHKASRPYALLPIACGFFYFFLGDELGDVWLVAKRFAAPGMMAAVPLLRMPRGVRGAIVTVGAIGIAVHATANTCSKFIWPSPNSS